ncbi:bifunctional DNA primase/polymerase [Bradyrhizobium barranii]|uniref:bifunctional DNA primase/polymerase n=1 Tax=Bradyrhizobium barranii TaxID=2992140 RepID=UPI003CCB68E0
MCCGYYAERGYPVFPCSNRTKAPLPPKDTDPETGEEIPKQWMAAQGLNRSPANTEWWTIWPNAMIGVATGERAGFWAIDPDAPKEPGDQAAKSLHDRNCRTEISRRRTRIQAQGDKYSPRRGRLAPYACALIC